MNNPIAAPHDQQATERRQQTLAWVLAAVILASMVCLVASGLQQLAWSDDEAVFIYTAQAVNRGHVLYDRVWFNYLPGFVRWLQMVFRLAGVSIITARLAVLFLVTISLIALWLLMRQVTSAWSATCALGLMVSMPHFVALSGAVMADVPSAILAAIAVLAAIAMLAAPDCRKRSEWRYLMIAGLAFAASLWLKPTSIGAALALALAVALASGSGRQRLGRVATLGLLVALPLLLEVGLGNPSGFARQFAASWLQSKSAFELDVGENLSDLFAYFVDDKYSLQHIGLLLMSAIGLAVLWARNRRVALVSAAWFAVAFASLIFHTPLYRQHILQLLLPIGLLAGIGATALWGILRRGSRAWRRIVAAGILLLAAAECCAGVYVGVTTLRAIEADHFLVGQRAIEYLRGHTEPGDLVITDAHILALRAGLDVPPETTNTSRMRIRAGQLTSQQMIGIVRRDRPVAIIFWEKKLDSLDDFFSWVECQYELGIAYSGRYRIYLRRNNAIPADMERLDVAFGKAVRLAGYWLDLPPSADNGIMDLTFYWQTVADAPPDLTVFVHLLRPDGSIASQHDGVPRDGKCPTWVWQPGDVVADSHPLPVSDLPAGQYDVIVGLYDSKGHRLSPGQVQIGTLGVRADANAETTLLWSKETR